MFASTGGDRSIALYDMRSARPIRKLIMQTRTNALSWNPMEAFNFTAASEDCNLYTYDMRKLQVAACVHKVCRGSGDWGRLGEGQNLQQVCWWASRSTTCTCMAVGSCKLLLHNTGGNREGTGGSDAG